MLTRGSAIAGSRTEIPVSSNTAADPAVLEFLGQKEKGVSPAVNYIFLGSIGWGASEMTVSE